MDILETALSWYNLGVTPLPIIPGCKRALVKWKHWQHKRPPRALVKAWFSRPCRLALMCGTGGLLVLDFDSLPLFIRWKRIHQQCYANSYSVRTSRPGMHVYFWCEDMPEKSVQLRNVDIKSTGYVLAPPSSGYDVVGQHEIMRVPSADVLVPGLRNDILLLAERAENGGGMQGCGDALEKNTRSTTLSPPSIFGPFGQQTKRLYLKPGTANRIKHELSILDLCNLYTDMRPGSNGYYWGRCPAPDHEDKNPSFSCDLTTGRATCWSARCKLHRVDGMDVIDLVEVMENCSSREAMMVLVRHLNSRR